MNTNINVLMNTNINVLMNTNIKEFKPLIKPNQLRDILPIDNNIQKFVVQSRKQIQDIIHKKSNKKLFIVGPCSIHDVDAALEYATKLKQISDLVKDKIFIVMRVYFEKPRTTVGWKGLINDPLLDDSFNVNKGLYLARELLLNINRLGLPCGYEVLDTITPQYISDLISWGAIGARTVESQVHRQMVSGLSMPVGFKNSTNGDASLAVNSVISAAYSHCFMGITNNGEPSICKTKGNKDCHIILRGGGGKPNFSQSHILHTITLCKTSNINQAIMIDCSHGNSNKDFTQQPTVLLSVVESMNIFPSVIGIMLESNLVAGKQKLKLGFKHQLKYGISITDSCIDIDTTKQIILRSYDNINTSTI
jgi:3-deoxy-7-phosphoheptulonate synthase